MKNNLRIFLIMAAFGMIFSCAENSFAQTKGPIVGGYAAADVKDRQVIAAANFAVKAEAKKQKMKIKLVSVNSAEQQVVAGMNYRLCLNVEAVKKGKKSAPPQTIQTTVYRNLRQKYKLTDWTKADCKSAATE